MIHSILGVVADESQLWDGIAREQHGDENGRNGVGKNHHAVLSDLGIGDTLHAAQSGVKENDGTTDDHTGGHVDGEQARKDQAHSTHLAHDVGHADEQSTDHGNKTSGIGVVSISQKVRHGEFSEFTQKWNHESCEQNKSAGPTHQKAGGIVARSGNATGHGDESGR